MIKITDLRDETGPAHADTFIAITVAYSPATFNDPDHSTSYLYPGEPGHDMIAAFLAMRAAAEDDG